MNSRKRRWPAWLVVCAASLIAACDMQEMIDDYASSEEAVFVKEHLALYPGREFDQILSQLDPSLNNDETKASLEELASYFPPGTPTNVVMVGYNWNASTNSWTGSVNYEFEYPSTYLLAFVGLTRVGDELRVTGINLQTTENSLQETNEFRFDGRGAVGYIFLVLAVIFPIICVVSFIACIRTPIPKRKWFWSIFTLLGVGVFQMNWTTGEVGFSVLSWQLLGAGFVKSGLYGPAIISIAAPFGAILFWIKRREWLMAPIVEPDDEVPPDD
ncbi:MAG: hypothetical protein ACR2QR_08445 [Woeseiaceae bacterium]